VSGGAQTRLAVYGSLAPGRPNHHHLSEMSGEWRAGTVRGRLMAAGWGAKLGFPGLVLNPDGEEIAVQIFESADLPANWPRLDAFEGEGYRRVVTAVVAEAGAVEACIYVLAGEPSGMENAAGR
jgi:gamma-glutamylcyclotransferase (GGCT)/AIG2-like uncharacterized protein YtfP